MYDLIRQLGRMFNWVFVVAPWEQALRIRLGKRVHELGPGIYCRIPFVDRVYRQSIRRRMSIIRPQTLTTQDNRTVTIAGALAYEIENLRRLFDTLESPTDSIEAEVCGLISTFVSARDLDDCLPPAIEKHVDDELDLKKYGLNGKEFRIMSFVVVKTYRFVTGDLPNWSRVHPIITTEHTQ